MDHNRNQQEPDHKGRQGNSSIPEDDQVKNVGSESNANAGHGHADLSNRPSEGAVGSTHSSGISTKRSVTGSDTDGQVSPS